MVHMPRFHSDGNVLLRKSKPEKVNPDTAITTSVYKTIC